MRRRIFFRIIPTLFMSACGFKLTEGNGNIARIGTIALDMPEHEDALKTVLREALQRQHVSVNPQATYRIRISNIRRQRLNTAIGANFADGDSKEVELLDSFYAEIFRRNQLLGEREISSRSIIRYHSNAYLGSSREEAQTHHRLASDNVRRLIRYLGILAR